MSNTINSLPPNNRDRQSARRRKGGNGLGCVVAFVLLVVGLGAAGVLLGPRLLNQWASGGAVAPVPITDDTSPEQLAERQAQELAQLNGYGWVDQESGIARIPIDQAINLLAETGLPVGVAEGDETATAEAAGDAAVDLANVNYQDDVLPIFQQRCAECHGDEEQEEGLKLTTYRAAMNGSQNGTVIEPGDPDSSYLVKLIANGQMPKRGDPLPQSEIDTIIAWIAAGAPETAPAATESEPAEAPVDLTNVNYQDHVLPIFQQHCAECHGDEEQEEGLKLTTYRAAMNGSQNGTVIEPGDPDSSYLVKLVVEGQMPKRGDPLSQEEIDIIIAWIEAGAPETAPATTETEAPEADTTETDTAETDAAETPVDLENVSFQAHVLPIFQEHCAKCHGDEEQEEGLKLTTYRAAINGSQNGTVIEPGDPDSSYLVKLVVEGQMPKRGEPLSPEEVEIITAWIAAGAPDN
jgi:mono/diheme cytochrome c family protein